MTIGATMAACLRASGFEFGEFPSWSVAGWHLLVLIVAAPLGFMIGLFPGFVVLCPLLHARGICNGAPFHVGDVVQIIAGPHQGTITRVYSGWQGDSVRVELGKTAEEGFQDVFTPVQLMRTNSGEQGDVPTRSPKAPGGDSRA